MTGDSNVVGKPLFWDDFFNSTKAGKGMENEKE
jgi:hypothetical protein